MEEEKTWFLVKIYLKSNDNTLEISMTQEELEELKKKKRFGRDFHFQTSHPVSDRLLIELSEIVAITEKLEYGDD